MEPVKSEATHNSRGFDFAYASRIFLEDVQITDARRGYGEIRLKAIGQVDAEMPTVVYTISGRAIRIISARRANRKERAQWLSRA